EEQEDPRQGPEEPAHGGLPHAEEVVDEEEEPVGHEHVEQDENVAQRRGEIAAQFPAGHGQHRSRRGEVHDALLSPAPRDALPRVSSEKTSSRRARSARSSESVQPASTARRYSSTDTSRPSRPRTAKRAKPSASLPTGSPDSTKGASTRRARQSSPRNVAYTTGPARRAPSSRGGPSATMRPLLMMSTRSLVASTSDRMCVEWIT